MKFPASPLKIGTSRKECPAVASAAILNVDCQGMNPTQIARARYRVIFAKDAQELEAKLNDTNFVPTEYAITHLTFNSGRAEYLVILERD